MCVCVPVARAGAFFKPCAACLCHQGYGCRDNHPSTRWMCAQHKVLYFHPEKWRACACSSPLHMLTPNNAAFTHVAHVLVSSSLQWRWLLGQLGVRDLMPVLHRRLHLSAQQAATSPWWAHCDLARASPACGISSSDLATAGLAGLEAEGAGRRVGSSSRDCVHEGVGLVVDDVESPGLQALLGGLVAKASSRCGGGLGLTGKQPGVWVERSKGWVRSSAVKALLGLILWACDMACGWSKGWVRSSVVEALSGLILRVCNLACRWSKGWVRSQLSRRCLV